MEAILIGLRRAGSIVGGILLLWQMLVGLQTLFDRSPVIFSPVYLFTAFGLIFLSYALQLISWGVLMRGLQLSIPWKLLFRGYILSFLPRYIPGSIWGYLSRSEWLRSEFQVSYTMSTCGSLLEITVALISTGWVAGIYAASLLDEPIRSGIVFGLVLVPIVIWVLVLGVSRVPWILRHINQDGQCPEVRLPFSSWLLSVMLIVWNMIMYGMALYLMAWGLGLDRLSSCWNVFVFAANYSIAWLTGFVVVFLPAGIGLREVTLSALLVVSLGLPAGQASLMAVMFRLTGTCAEVVWVAIGLLLSTRCVEVCSQYFKR